MSRGPVNTRRSASSDSSASQTQTAFRRRTRDVQGENSDRPGLSIPHAAESTPHAVENALYSIHMNIICIVAGVVDAHDVIERRTRIEKCGRPFRRMSAGLRLSISGSTSYSTGSLPQVAKQPGANCAGSASSKGAGIGGGDRVPPGRVQADDSWQVGPAASWDRSSCKDADRVGEGDDLALRGLGHGP